MPNGVINMWYGLEAYILQVDYFNCGKKKKKKQ